MGKRAVSAKEITIGGVTRTEAQWEAIFASSMPKEPGLHPDTLSQKDAEYASHQFTRVLPTGEEIVWSVKHSGFVQCLPDLRFSGPKNSRRSIPGFGGDEARWAAYATYFRGPDFASDLPKMIAHGNANRARVKAKSKGKAKA